MWTTDAPSLDDAPYRDATQPGEVPPAVGPPPFVADGSSFSAQPNGSADPWGDTDAASEWTRPRVAAPVDGPFSAEPIPHDDDVIDSGDLFDPTFEEPWATPSAGSVFSNGATSNGSTSTDSATAPAGSTTRDARHVSPLVDDSPWTVVDDDWERAAGSSVRDAAAPDPRVHDAGVRVDDVSRSRPAGASAATGYRSHGAHDDVVADPQGLEAAIARLPPVDQERTSVPIAVCGALLEPDEAVVGVVTGQMLGLPAAVMVTDRRVVIANDRRWQPLVDVYRIDSKLIVRGRHDRHVAALSFADTERLSMIDGIFEVELAIELAERIRDTDPID